MATLYISEYSDLAKTSVDFKFQAPQEPALADQTVTISGTSAQSSAFNANTRLVMVVTDTACHIIFGSSPTATTSKKLLPANVPMYFGVTGAHKVAVIAAA